MKLTLALTIILFTSGCTTVQSINRYFWGDDEQVQTTYEPTCSVREVTRKNGALLYRIINGKFYGFDKEGNLCLLKI